MRTKAEIREWRKKRIRKKISGSTEKPRLSVFRSASHIYAQVVNDEENKTLFAVSSLSAGVKGESGTKTDMAKKVGNLVAQKCLENDIKQVVFDRNGFVYHGRVKALADAAREAGLEF